MTQENADLAAIRDLRAYRDWMARRDEIVKAAREAGVKPVQIIKESGISKGTVIKILKGATDPGPVLEVAVAYKDARAYTMEIETENSAFDTAREMSRHDDVDHVTVTDPANPDAMDHVYRDGERIQP